MYGDWLLYELLQSRRAFGASDPRDLVFAHVLIARATDIVGKYRDLIQIDYNKDCCKVFEEVARYLFENGNEFSVFSLVADVECSMRRHGLASWVPDWTMQLPDSPWTSISRWMLMSMGPARTHSENHVYGKWCVTTPSTHGWFASIFTCVGVEISPVDQLSSEIDLPLKTFDVAQFLKHQ